MNSKAMISGIIGLVLVIIMIGLVVVLQPQRHFDAWWILFPIALVGAGFLAVAMMRRGK